MDKQEAAPTTSGNAVVKHIFKFEVFFKIITFVFVAFNIPPVNFFQIFVNFIKLKRLDYCLNHFHPFIPFSVSTINRVDTYIYAIRMPEVHEI